MRAVKRRITITAPDEKYAQACALAFAKSPSLRNYGSVSGVLRYALMQMRQSRRPVHSQLDRIERIARRLAQGTIDAKTASRFIEESVADVRMLAGLDPHVAESPDFRSGFDPGANVP